MWFVVQIVLMVIGFVATYRFGLSLNDPEETEGMRIFLASVAGFCFSYWVTWAIFKFIDAPTRVRNLLSRAKALWF